MQRDRIAAFGITLAISSVAAWAAPGDAWYGTSKDEDKVERPPLDATPAPAESITYEERINAPTTREELVLIPEPRESVIEVPVQRAPPYDPRHPQKGQLLERGLFNRTGPNDFGA